MQYDDIKTIKILFCRGVYPSDKDDKTSEYSNTWASFAADAHIAFHDCYGAKCFVPVGEVAAVPIPARPGQNGGGFRKTSPPQWGALANCRLQPVVSKCALVSAFFI